MTRGLTAALVCLTFASPALAEEAAETELAAELEAWDAEVPVGHILRRWGGKAKEKWVHDQASLSASSVPEVRVTTASEREAALQATIDGILGAGAIATGISGVYVWDVASGRPLYAHGADRQLNPASNVKLVSTAAALNALGPAHRFETRVMGPPPDDTGTIVGDVTFVGAGDPLLGPTDLHAMALDVAASGVRRITGDLQVGRSAVLHGMGHRGLRIQVTGADTSGSPPEVHVYPASPYFRIVNQVTTNGRRRRPKMRVQLVTVVDPATRQPVVEVRLTGQVRPGQVVYRTRGVPGGSLFAAHTLASYLALEGVRIDGKVTVTPGFASGVSLARRQSATVAELAALVNKPSWNWLADRLIGLAGAVLVGGEPSLDSGLALMKSYLAALGLDATTVRLDNASGLSYTNHLSPRQIVATLVNAATEQPWGPEYMTSLAVGEVDGTLRRRLDHCACRRFVRGKTGTLTSVAALSGFVSARDARPLAFAIVSNGFSRNRISEVRKSQDAIVKALHDHLTRDAAPDPERPPTVASTFRL